MQLHVWLEAMVHFTITVEASDTIAWVKAKIDDAQGIPPDRQRLIFGQWPSLQDGWTVAECGMHEGATVHLALPRLSGGNILRMADRNTRRRALLRGLLELEREDDNDAWVEG